MWRLITRKQNSRTWKDVDVVLDPVGKDTLARSYGVVKKGGIVTTLVSRVGSSGAG